MQKRSMSFRRARVIGVALLTLAGFISLPAPALAQATQQARYEQALERERAARAVAAPNVATLRTIAVSYENIVRRYPRSGYADNALWQGAGLLQLAWETGGARRDRDQAIKLLQWLRREYPTSSLARQANGRIAAINRPRSSAVAATNAPAVTPAPAASAVPPVVKDELPASRSVTTAAVPASTAAAATTATRTPPPARAVTTPPPAAHTPAPAPTAQAETSGNAVVLRGLSHTPLPRGDRLTIELSEEGKYTSERLNAPDELTITLPDARAAAAIINAASTIRGDRIRSMRLQQSDKGVQVVVRLDGRPRYSEFPLYGPYRLVLDFESDPTTPEPAASTASAAVPASATREPRANVDRPSARQTPAPSRQATAPPSVRESPAPVPAASAATAVIASVAPSTGSSPVAPAPEPLAAPAEAAAGPAPPSSTIGGGYSLARQLGLGVSRIVIDPGHGGADPGASSNGVTEASLVLDVALRLEKLLLEQPGFEVVLTRRANGAVPLARRTAIANEQDADLFLSIHANSSPRTQTAGVETYFLNFASNQQAEAVAARENASSPQAMHSLPELVRAITMNNKLAESRELAGAVQASLVRRLRPRNRQFQDLGVKQAPFVVLIGAQMPSVLAEIAFLTNRQEASLLKQNAYKQQIAQALCDAILRYQGSLKKNTTVTASAEGR